jgi:hypothetical protein
MKADVNYFLELYKTRKSLMKKGVPRPISRMIEEGIIKKDVRNWVYINGRVIDKPFLKKLKKLDDMIE